ncbi:MAG: ATPase family protein associated with various cellular activities (AAA) [uncultured Sulfurovum sp.]|uniref:ATPase family protein associated with various cellular activities (AAA) n=1 Tax=uncultured Sulfurovum sp. TaxID=269237 RepID=A0A6S6SZX1_9BACT|nr:MAG: ATPase family protein associated with various cellular activities (AAA) [uncultured Sulfurovum sp.]
MLWIQTDEDIYYNRDTAKVKPLLKQALLERMPTLSSKEIDIRIGNIFFDPNEETIHSITDKEDIQTSTIISPSLPTKYGYGEMGFFTTIEIRGDNYPFTQEQINLEVPKDYVIYKRYGLVAKTPKATLDGLAGAEALTNDIAQMQILQELGIRTISAVFLFGVAGAGKSFWAEAFAGTTKSILLELDLAHFMSLPSPTRALEEMFDFFLSQKNQKYVILIDEIEKMFDFTGNSLIAKQVLGNLLTRLNTLYKLNYSNITIVATANNITQIVQNNPEFLRKGRFNRLYFLNYPSKSSAAKIFSLYMKKNQQILTKSIDKHYQEYIKKVQRKSTLLDRFFDDIEEKKWDIETIKIVFCFQYNIEECIRTIEEIYKRNKKTTGDHFVYSPPEIQAFSEELQDKYMLLLMDENIFKPNYDKISQIIKAGTMSKNHFTILDSQEHSLRHLITKIASLIIPLQISAAEGVSNQIAQSTSFSTGANKTKQFIEVS